MRICSHDFANGAWLEEGILLRDAGRLAGIPGVLFHGRLDLTSPIVTAWELAHAWPDARLIVVDDSGHTGSGTMRDQICDSLDGFAMDVQRPVGAPTWPRFATSFLIIWIFMRLYLMQIFTFPAQRSTGYSHGFLGSR